MELTARHFECHPAGIPAYTLVSPLVGQLGEVSVTGHVGEKNSGQCDTDLDDRLAERFWKMRGVSRVDIAMPAIEKQFDFSFRFQNQTVVVEVEKANWEKVLYDFLKAHMYLASGADFVVVFVPKNYVHSGKSPTKTFQKARQRYDQCIAYSFGSPENFGRILLVGYEQALRDGQLFTPTHRKQFIEAARRSRAVSQRGASE
jgi:hypothetical protein